MAVGQIETEAELRRFVEDVVGDLPQKIAQLQGMVRRGTGTPEGAVLAPPGVVFEREDGGVGSSFYVKQTGGTLATGWLAVA